LPNCQQPEAYHSVVEFNNSLEESVHFAIRYGISGGKPMTGLLYRNLTVAAIVLLAGCLTSYAAQAPTARAKKTFDELTKMTLK
jgi:hypothetical protein